MVDSTHHANDDLDAAWDSDAPVPSIAPVQSLPPSPELEQLDAGWDQQTERSNPKPAPPLSGAPASGTLPLPLDSIDEGWDADDELDPIAAIAADHAKKAALSKKDRRRLERDARAHQVERVHENRIQRKAERRELAQQRASEIDAKREAERKQQLERKQKKSAKRASRIQATVAAKPAPTSVAAAPPDHPTVATPNRAERRAKARSRLAAEAPKPTPPSLAAKQKPLMGPFAIFMAVILAASLLSYYAFMN
jgi:hypothetical protein